MSKFELGQKVFVPAKLNSVWTGIGVVVRNWDDGFVSLDMETGGMKGKRGGFEETQLQAPPFRARSGRTLRRIGSVVPTYH